MSTYTRIGEWVRAYGGRKNHLVVGFGHTDSVTGLADMLFACGKSDSWSQWGYDSNKPDCEKCKRAQRPPRKISPALRENRDEDEKTG